MKVKDTILLGYDNRGILYENGNDVVRKIFPNYINEVTKILDLCIQNNPDDIGIVKSKIYRKEKNKLEISHEKHLIAYPYEWTASMYKDAVIFYLELSLKLDQYGLGLKDAIPQNILFKNIEPVFVDFLSIMRIEDISRQEWLQIKNEKEDPRISVLKTMFIPYMLIPFLLFGNKEYTKGREVLFEKTCNSIFLKSPTWEDAIMDGKQCLSIERVNTIRDIFNENISYVSMCKRILKEIKSISVLPNRSGYLDYYSNKQENFDFENASEWKKKQTEIYKILKQLKPESVLDIGSNTGWFSLLAEKMGSQVVSIDIDEASVDLLYQRAKERNLKIMPLKLSFDELEKELYGAIYPEYCDDERDFQEKPIFKKAVDRWKFDLILCLGLLHHLILGEGKSIEYIVGLVSKMTRCVVFEFVDLSDDLIKNNHDFFPFLKRFSAENYNINLYTEKLRKEFPLIQIFNSHPKSRKLLVCRK